MVSLILFIWRLKLDLPVPKTSIKVDNSVKRENILIDKLLICSWFIPQYILELAEYG